MCKALIVEDQTKIRNLYKRLLTAESFKVLEAKNGQEAGLILLQRSDIDLVLLDIRMPAVSRSALFNLIQFHNPKAKVIVIGAYPLDDQRRVMDGVDGYHDKSEGARMLLSRVKDVMSKTYQYV